MSTLSHAALPTEAHRKFAQRRRNPGRLLGRMAVRHADDAYLSAAVMSSAVGHSGQMVVEVMADRNQLAARSKLIADLLNVAVAAEDLGAEVGAQQIAWDLGRRSVIK